MKVFTIPINQIPNNNEFLNQKERERISKIKDPLKAEVKSKCRNLLKVLLARVLECHPRDLEFCYEKHGKPYLEAYPLHFNISHSGDYFMLAYSKKGKIGVDCEDIDLKREWKALQSKVCSPQEIKSLEKFNEEKARKAFFQLWTQKEAYSKYEGQGLLQSFSDLNLGFELKKQYQGKWLISFFKDNTWFTICTTEEDIQIRSNF